MQFFSVLTAGLALACSAIALPTQPTSDQTSALNPLFQRADTTCAATAKCPSADTMAAWVKSNSKHDVHIFYTGSANTQNARALAAALAKQSPSVDAGYFSTVFMANTKLQESGYFKWLDDCGGKACEQQLVIPRMSEALAKASTGKAYLLIKEGDTIDHTKIWYTAEYPALKKNNVEVIMVNSGTADFETHLQTKKYDGVSPVKFS